MITYRTIVTELPATPLGRLPARWNIEHHCTTCRRIVAANELVTHAQRHGASNVHHQGGQID